MRRNSRVQAFKMIFERFFTTAPVDDELWEELNEKDAVFAKEIFDAYTENKEKIEGMYKIIEIKYLLPKYPIAFVYDLPIKNMF